MDEYHEEGWFNRLPVRSRRRDFPAKRAAYGARDQQPKDDIGSAHSRICPDP